MNNTFSPDGGRTFQDMRKWNKLIGKTFYERNPKNPHEIRTYYMSWNGFANKIIPQISNYVVMEPTPEMEPFHPKILSAVMTAQPSMNSFY